MSQHSTEAFDQAMPPLVKSGEIKYVDGGRAVLRRFGLILYPPQDQGAHHEGHRQRRGVPRHARGAQLWQGRHHARVNRLPPPAENRVATRSNVAGRRRCAKETILRPARLEVCSESTLSRSAFSTAHRTEKSGCGEVRSDDCAEYESSNACVFCRGVHRIRRSQLRTKRLAKLFRARFLDEKSRARIAKGRRAAIGPVCLPAFDAHTVPNYQKAAPSRAADAVARQAKPR